MNNSKYLDLNNVDTTPSQELLSQLVEMCSKSNGKYDAMECFFERFVRSVPGFNRKHHALSGRCQHVYIYIKQTR